jgi:hypothetical protein
MNKTEQTLTILAARRWLPLDLSDQLHQYVNDPTIFIHYSKINKIGINPEYSISYSTPLGIYSYPKDWNDLPYSFKDVPPENIIGI